MSMLMQNRPHPPRARSPRAARRVMRHRERQAWQRDLRDGAL